jgi:hypothetical protein
MGASRFSFVMMDEGDRQVKVLGSVSLISVSGTREN